MRLQGFVATLAIAIPAVAQEEVNAPTAEQGNNPINAVVKIEVETAKSLISRPWVNRTDYGTGSGVVIDNGRILTCAHCVTDASSINIRKHNEDTLYHATVLFVDNDAVLVLGQVGEPKFMFYITILGTGRTTHN